MSLCSHHRLLLITQWKVKVVQVKSRVYLIRPDKPGVPVKPSVKGKMHSHSFKITWGKIFCIFVCHYFIFDLNDLNI